MRLVPVVERADGVIYDVRRRLRVTRAVDDLSKRSWTRGRRATWPAFRSPNYGVAFFGHGRTAPTMFPFWETVVAPLIEAAGARRIVEIGALRGETTALMLDGLGPRAELHVIDPVPEFDPGRARAPLPGPVHLPPRPQPQRARPAAGAIDVALVDGDHNWYTVYNELRLLARGGRAAAGAPLPVLILHDVGWPYGRRDLYYEPDADPRGVPPAVPARRACSPAARELLPRRRHEPDAATTPSTRAARATA